MKLVLLLLLLLLVHQQSSANNLCLHPLRLGEPGEEPPIRAVHVPLPLARGRVQRRHALPRARAPIRGRQEVYHKAVPRSRQHVCLERHGPQLDAARPEVLSSDDLRVSAGAEVPAGPAG